MELISYLKQFAKEERVTLFEDRVGLRTRHLCLVLENIYQSHNISAVLRSADCFGIQDVHIIENSNEFEVNTEISLGASKWLTLHRYHRDSKNTKEAIQTLKNQGYKVIATTPHTNDCTLQELDITQKTALVFGTELTGITEEVKELADGFVRIPMYGFTESFNISVAAALSCYELSKRLREEQDNWELSHSEKQAILLDWLKASIKHSDQIVQRYEQEHG